MKKGEKLKYHSIGTDDDYWIRYRAGDLFEFSAPPDAELHEIHVGDTFMDWTKVSLAMQFGIRMVNAPSGLAPPYRASMNYLVDDHRSIAERLSEYESKLTSDGHRDYIDWVDGMGGRVPLVSEFRDEYTLVIRSLFVHGGNWELCHRIACENPQTYWPEVARRLTSSIKFLCPELECRNLLYFE